MSAGDTDDAATFAVAAGGEVLREVSMGGGKEVSVTGTCI